MTIYNTGTVAVAEDSATVTGTGTSWALSLVTGGMFSFAGMSIPIASVESNTSLTLAYAWPGEDATGAYAIATENSEAASVVDLNTTLSRVLVTLSLAGIHPNASGTIADRDAISLSTNDEGFLFLHAEIGVAFAFYRWTSTAWEGPFQVQGAAGEQGAPGLIGDWLGPWVTATAYAADDAVSEGGSSYIATTAHTAGTFATDLAAGKWALVAAKGDTGAAGADGADGADGLGTGDFVGPASSAADNIVTFNGTTGKLGKDSGVAVSSLAPKASPTFTGTPAAPTAAAGTNTTQIATTGFVKAAIDVVLGGVSSAFDTLSEIATAIGLLAPKASPTFTGTPAAPTATAGTNTTQIATTAFVATAVASVGPPNYGTGNAALSYGGVGTYIWAAKISTATLIENTTYAGSSLFPAGAANIDPGADTSGSNSSYYGGSALSGTWRAMGRVNSASAVKYSLFLRIS